MRSRLHLTGERFGRLVSICDTETDKYGNRIWMCLCDCGNTVSVNTNNLRSGHTKSCGCLSREVTGKRSLTHGGSESQMYSKWTDMKTRCYNQNRKEFKYYGGRGIKVCNRWLNSFENFFVDMGEPPTPKHSIDRINNDGNYEPTNCRWATALQQRHNRRR